MAHRHCLVGAGGLAPAGERQNHRRRVVRRFRAAHLRCPRQHRDLLGGRLWPRGQARHGARRLHRPGGRCPVGPSRRRGPRARGRRVSVPDRQDLGPDRRDRGGPPDRLRDPVVGACVRAPATELENEPFTDIVHPEDSHVVLDHVLDLTGDEGEAAAFEVRMQHANGEWRTIAWTASNLLADPSVNGYVLNGFDVTEARQASEDLLSARDAVVVASKTKSEFVSMMSHEIRTPMNGVIGLTELLLETELDVEQQELASGVKVSADRLLVIINDILDFSKIEAGKLEIEEVTFDVRRVVDDVGRILAGTAHAKGIELLVHVDPSVPSALLGDVTRIQQVLLNFGSNGVKFTAEGEVVIRLSVLHETRARGLAFRGDRHRHRHRRRRRGATVQPLRAGRHVTTRSFGGTGLGLTICRQLVELMGGRSG